jgi:hypothetical protein
MIAVEHVIGLRSMTGGTGCAILIRKLAAGMIDGQNGSSAIIIQCQWEPNLRGTRTGALRNVFRLIHGLSNGHTPRRKNRSE